MDIAALKKEAKSKKTIASRLLELAKIPTQPCSTPWQAIPTHHWQPSRLCDTILPFTF